MAALTATNTYRESVGSMTLLVYTFSSVSTGDTFASGLGSNALFYNAIITQLPTTQASAGYGVGYNSTTGVFTLYPGENSDSAALQVLARV